MDWVFWGGVVHEFSVFGGFTKNCLEQGVGVVFVVKHGVYLVLVSIERVLCLDGEVVKVKCGLFGSVRRWGWLVHERKGWRV
jgi:hypothetical protein